ncbi:DNA primase [Ferdinandcohnia quinoae]|uniref:DNA primase n=1 Tax=Fredinandcohnia quinoae TaxID=2918902 RepID=A0AAW5E102_9BACI|nr:DNA primase [Fredinandcohnia sp. SECRCQ15]MCH1624965.1 DNA primase [Fredinandcohnia sp. SECRCQ15]
MGNRIPEETIEKIRLSVDIVDVISEYVQLKKQGRNYFGLCPFHGENTPSFSVSPDKQIFHCFGCGAGGNVFSFLMDIEGYTFSEAAINLANKVNIDLQSYSAQPTEKHNDASTMITAHELLKKFYHHLLLNTKEGQHALDYLTNRGFTREIIEKFEIGYALDSWDFITKFLQKRGFKLELMEQAGLLIRKENGGTFFDRFRNRIMFPLWDHQGKTIAFSGRVLDKSQEPKYLNSPESIIFNKSKTLYNFHQARLHIRKNQQVILFEGFADVIASDRAGLQHTIATMGTSLTEEQVKIIRRNVESVIVCYDSDQAGVDAALRASSMLTEAGCYVKVAQMPDGLDPDDYIKKFGSEKFKNDVIGASLTLMAFKMQYFRRGKNLQDEGERIRYIEDVVKEISSLDKAVEKDHYLRQLSNEFSISLDALKQQQHQYNREERKKKDNHTWNRNNSKAKTIVSTKLLPAFHNAERLLIAHMLRNQDTTSKVQDSLQANFNIEEHRAIVTYLYAFYEDGNEPDISAFLSRIHDPNLKRVVTDIAMLSISEEILDAELADYIKQVLKQQNLSMIKEKEIEKHEAERNKDYLKAASIAMEIIQMQKNLK